MKLSKPIYEKLPYLYLIIGISLFFLYDHIGIELAGALFYYVAALVWIKRSDYRRQTRVKTTVKHIRTPQSIYEFYPFAFIAMGLFIVKYFPQPLPLAAALILTLIGLKTLVIRRQSRLNPLKFGGNHIQR
ncbi:hypothetical protein AADZ86_01355 [Colwelliaceae bacterium BS250]